MPWATSARHAGAASAAGSMISNPSSPVYPVRATNHESICAPLNRVILCAELRRSGAMQRHGLGDCVGALNREHREIRAFAHFNRKGARVFVDPGEILPARAGVDDQPEPATPS